MNANSSTLTPQSDQTAAPPSAKKRGKKRSLSAQYTAYLIHSFVGLKLSLILTLVLASGTLAVIANEIDWLLMPEMRVTPTENRINDGQLFDKLQAAYPNSGLGTFQPNSHQPYTAAQASYNDAEGGFRMAWINPYSGEVTGDTPLLTMGRFLSFLHTTLYLPVIGRSLVNAFGIFTLLSIVTGLIAYPKFWRYFLRKPRTGNLRVFLADMHKLIGLWSIWFLLIIGISGSWWFYKTPLVTYAGAPSITEPFERRPILDYAELDKFGTSTPTPLSNERIVEIVNQQYPQLDIRWLSPPEHNADPYEIGGKMGEVLVNSGNRIYINPYDGEIIKSALVKNFTTTQRFDRAMAPLHYGNWADSGVADLTVKFIWFLFGALMTALAVTGLIINLKRTRRSAKIFANRSKRTRQALQAWRVIRPWGGALGVFKYINVLMLVGVCAGIGIALTLSSQGVKNVGYEYVTQPIGPWTIKVNAYAGLLEKDLPPIRAGLNTNFAVEMPKEAFTEIKFVYARIGKPRTLRAPGTLIHGPIGAKHARFRLPKNIRENAQLWVTAITWSGEVYQAHWPLMPNGKETIDVR